MLAARACCGDDGKKYIELYVGFNIGISAGASARASGSREGLVNIVTVGDEMLSECLTGPVIRGPRDASVSMTIASSSGVGATILVERGKSGGPKANVGLSPAAGVSAILNLFGADIPIEKFGPIDDCCQ